MTERLGIVDWGIGGLGVVRELRARRPGLGFVYVSDSGAVPYGKQSGLSLARGLAEICGKLTREHGVTTLAVACNAASPVVGELRERTSLRVEGLIDDGIDVALRSGARTVGVVGGARTIRSGLHARALRARGLTVTPRIAQPLSALIEAGEASGDAFAAEVMRITAPLRSVDALLLACTHYPAAKEAFAKALPGVSLLDPAGAFAARLLASWHFDDGPATYLTSGGREATALAAQRAWGMRIAEVGAFR